MFVARNLSQVVGVSRRDERQEGPSCQPGWRGGGAAGSSVCIDRPPPCLGPPDRLDTIVLVR